MISSININKILKCLNPYCRDQAVGGLYVNANKTVCIRFKQKETISTLRDKLLKLVDLFT